MDIVAETLPTYDEFLTTAETWFSVAAGDGTHVDLFLLKISEVAANEFTASFSLIFRAPADFDPAQGVYSLTHKKLGVFDLFLVPMRRDADGVYFESIFNNLVERAA